MMMMLMILSIDATTLSAYRRAAQYQARLWCHHATFGNVSDVSFSLSLSMCVRTLNRIWIEIGHTFAMLTIFRNKKTTEKMASNGSFHFTINDLVWNKCIRIRTYLNLQAAAVQLVSMFSNWSKSNGKSNFMGHDHKQTDRLHRLSRESQNNYGKSWK